MSRWAAFTDYKYGKYYVLEMTLIDGKDDHLRLLGIINTGDADCNTGYWGSVYTRPDFKEIATLEGDTNSSHWNTDDTVDTVDSCYTAPSPALPKCNNPDQGPLLGGQSAESPFEVHLSHALGLALCGKISPPADDDEEEEERPGSVWDNVFRKY